MHPDRPQRLAAGALPLVFLLLGLNLLPAQDLVESTLIRQVGLEELRERYGFFAQFPVSLYKVTYTTPDIQGVRDTASGLIALPDGPGEALPVLCYQHGTSGSKDDVPSNLRGGYQIAELFASLGYFAVAADYLGLGEARGFHPYVHAGSETSAAVDMLRASKTFAAGAGQELDPRHFLIGYSQGGHASMALHRFLEAEGGEEVSIAAAAHMAGPYSVSGVMREQMLSDEAYLFPVYVIFTLLSYDLVYDLYEDLEEYLVPKYAQAVDQFLEGPLDLFQLNSLIVQELTQDFGASLPRRMFQDSVLAAIRADREHPFNRALADNDVYEWAPQAPTRLFHCAGDDQVPFANTTVAEAAMQQLGATDLTAIQVDGSEPLDHGQCVEPALRQAVLFFSLILTDTEAPAPLALEVGPNPVRDILYLRGLPDAARVSLVDLSGRAWRGQRVEGGELELELADLPPAMYLLRVESAAGTYQGKIVVAPR